MGTAAFSSGRRGTTKWWMRYFPKSLAKTLQNVPIILGRCFISVIPSMGTISLLQWEKGDHEVVDEVFSEKLDKNFTSRPHKIG